MSEKVHKLIIIGSGPAGLTAAIYAARANLNPLIIDGDTPGGQLMGTTTVDNWPGTPGIQGPQLMKEIRDHTKQFQCSFASGVIERSDFSQQPYRLWNKKNKLFQATSIIIATGATPKRLDCPGEEKYWGKGVTTCAVCDGAFYKDKPVVIVGGGDTAMEDASFMQNFTDKITIVQNLDHLTASESLKSRVVDKEGITILYQKTVSKIIGDENKVTSVEIKDLTTNEVVDTIKATGVFIAIGLSPNTEPFKGQLDLLENGYLKLQGQTKTSVEGVFAAGDVHDFKYRQAITASGAGCKAALDAEKYIKGSST